MFTQLKKLSEVEKDKILDDALSRMEKDFGSGSILRLDRPELVPNLEVIPSGNIGVDYLLGVGGYPRGRTVEIFGNEQAGKTTLALHAVASAQRLGARVAIIDAEHALDFNYARDLGVDVTRVMLSQPECGEQALDITEKLVETGVVDLVVIDSVAALVPKAELEGEMGDKQMGEHARLMSKAMRKLTGIVSRTGSVIIFINQLRQKIGVMWGSPDVTTGGNALKFYCTIRIELRNTGDIKDGNVRVGNTVKIKVVKNKVAPPYREGIFELYYGSGFVPEIAVIDLAEKFSIIEKSGSWYKYGGVQIGQGKGQVREFFKTSAGGPVFAEIEQRVRSAVFPVPVVVSK